jgi:transcription elongation factor GreA
MERVPMTAEGYERLEAELRKLKTEARPAVIRALSDAREHGDLSENAEYHAARERQGFVEARVRELEDKVSRAQVIDVSKLSGNTVKFGATVTLAEEESGEETTYQIVGADESDISQGRLSITAPLARAMIQKSVGDIATVQTPGGSKSYEIVAVAFG